MPFEIEHYTDFVSQARGPVPQGQYLAALRSEAEHEVLRTGGPIREKFLDEAADRIKAWYQTAASHDVPLTWPDLAAFVSQNRHGAIWATFLGKSHGMQAQPFRLELGEDWWGDCD